MDLASLFGFSPPSSGRAAPTYNTTTVDNTSLNSSSKQTRNGAGPMKPDVVDTFLTSVGRGSPLVQVLLFVYRLIGSNLGFDPSMILTVLGFIWGVSKLLSQAQTYIGSFADKHLMCSITIAGEDAISTHLMTWLSQNSTIAKSNSLMAETIWKSAWEEHEDDMLGSLFWTDGGEDDGKQRRYLNFSNQAIRSSPRYVPAMGSTSFWYKGNYFKLYRKKESVLSTASSRAAVKEHAQIRIACLGRSSMPIKNLLGDAKILHHHDTAQKTVIYRPKSKEQRSGIGMWQTVARRPVRPMRTVVLDVEEKHSVLRDVNDYLHPATPRWYAARGIPLRRGYLLHGPPGTGKTSFSFALAGVFGIDIYVISLQDANISEEDLAHLFTRLPRRCVVLLEDIDTAGLRRPVDEDQGKPDDDDETVRVEGKATKKDTVSTTTDTAETTNGVGKGGKSKTKKSKVEESEDEKEEEEPEKKSRNRHKGGKGRDRTDTKSDPASEGISLSGLLNAIDGVASHEGRVLIMTTNKPESLDEALVRPGRVDMQVAFFNANSTQAGELFKRMYEGPMLDTGVSATTPSKVEKEAEIEVGESTTSTEQPGDASLPSSAVKEESVSDEELGEISKRFGQLIPEGKLSPAEIQGFLLKRKTSPRQALNDAKEWIEATMQQKEEKIRVKTVQ